MSVKYRLDYKNDFDQQCRVDIGTSSYLGDPIPVRGVGGAACTIDYSTDSIYAPICNSKATISMIQQGQIDILELQETRDRTFTAEYYVDSVLKWKGFLIPDGIQRMFQSEPFDLVITATDGLMLLDTIPFANNNLLGGRCIMNFFRLILFASENLGLALPIRWVNTVKSKFWNFEDDVFTGSVQWSPFGEGFTDYNGNDKSCLYILENILKSMECRIFQANGKWNIERINDIVTGSYTERQILGSLEGLPTPTVSTVDNNKIIAGKSSAHDYHFLDEDAMLTVEPGIKRVITRYEQDQRDNILPNGSFDIVNSLSDTPIYWGLQGSPSFLLVESIPSLSDQPGNAVQITNFSGAPTPAAFRLAAGPLPIDSEVLYKKINIGFKFSLISGATIDSNGFIVWASTNLTYMVVYNDNTDNYYLNENGFWVKNVLTSIKIVVNGLKLNDIAQIDFNAKQDILLPLPSSPIMDTNYPSLQVTFNLVPGQKMAIDDAYVNVDSNNDVYEATVTGSGFTGKEEMTLQISSSHNGFYVSNYMPIYAQSGIESYFFDSKFEGSLTALCSHSVLRNRYKSAINFSGSVYGKDWFYGQVYNIETLDSKKFVPLNCSYNTETCAINIEALECRDDAPGITMKHYGSNDKPTLSN
jgi:hypothetical protein